MIRGGGDIDDIWINSARRHERYKAIDDYESVIIDIKQRLNLTSKQIVLYGRSAGGLPVGSIIARHPYGQLIGAAFTEVPYVDLLRTTTNPSLPLTQGEYEEFGNPHEQIRNFKGLLDISPINSLPVEGAPGIFVLDRVGLKDWQVFAYESFKWIQRLRGFSNKMITKPYNKYIIFNKSQGHHYSIEEEIKARSTDLAILDAWVEDKLNLSD
jgi:oligopeptidase B